MCNYILRLFGIIVLKDRNEFLQGEDSNIWTANQCSGFYMIETDFMKELKQQADHFRDFRKVHKLIRPQQIKFIRKEIVFPVKNPYIQIYKYIRKIKIK